MKKIMTAIAGLAMSATAMMAQEPDPNFYIYLCYGQSNMEGAGQIEQIDRKDVPERFKMMAAVNFDSPQREMYQWYEATPPLVRQGTGLCPADWFGRTMVDNLPEDVRIGVIVVAVGGAGIQHLDKDYDTSKLDQEADWFQQFMKAYDKKPYDRLVACAKEAQKVGVIKGMLLHQGETNNMDQTWPTKVKKVYEDILTDLSLQAEDVPLLVGETVRSEMGGYCGGHNAIINAIHGTIPTAYPISAANLENKGDGLHFTSHAYRVLGCRYATKMLNLMGIEDPVVKYKEEEPDVPTPEPSEGDFVFDFKYFDPSFFGDGTFDAETGTFVGGQWGCGGWNYVTPIDLSGYQYLVAELQERQTNNAQLRVWDTPGYFDKSFERDFGSNTLLVSDLKGMMKNLDTGITALNTKTVYRVGIWCYGGQPIKIKQIFATNVDPYASVESVSVDAQSYDVYTLQGVRLLTDCSPAELESLPHGYYIINGRVEAHN